MAESALNRFVAADSASVRLLNEVRRIAAANASTVLVRGETGVGKDLVASLIHYLGHRPEEPLVALDCGALPQELIESELFGYERTAFTGTRQMKRGRLELAGEGTLVLDEVAALSMPLQAKLFRVIQEQRFERLGSSRSVALQARIVALTSVDLEHAVARRTFREDLYYRLNVVPIVVPPLRERPGDIRPLAEAFLARLADIHRKPAVNFDALALAALQAYGYPGNARELRAIVEQAVIASAGPQIIVSDLPAHMREAAGPVHTGELSLEQMERAHIADVLGYTRGKKTQAARILGISRKTLLEKRKRYALR